MTVLSDNLLTRLLTADICCKDCGTKYGKYSVGCSSTWYGDCQVCGEYKPVTEVRDWGYLTKGINEEKAKIKEQSKEVAEYMAEQENESASYERGEIACMFTEEEITALAGVLESHKEEHPPSWCADYDSAFEKINDLFNDYCIKYELSPALRAYRAKYGTWGTESPEEEAKWQGFRDAYTLLNNND